MKNRQKIVISIVGILSAVAVLVFAAFLLAPNLLDSEWVKDKIRSKISEAADVDIDFNRVRLQLFPSPCVVLDHLQLSLPPGVNGRAESVRIHPKILSLFRGNVQIKGVRIDSAEIDYTLPPKSGIVDSVSEPLSLPEIKQKIRSGMSMLSKIKFPNLETRISHTRVRLFDQDRELFEFTGVHLNLEGPSTGRKITLDCKSGLWQSISISSLMDTNTLKGNGQIRLTQLMLQHLSRYFFTGSALKLVDAPVNLTIDFKTDGPERFRARVNGSATHINFHHTKESLNIKTADIKAEFKVDKNSMLLSLPLIAFEYPQLKLSANLGFTENTPSLTMQIKGTQIDVAATRQTALVLLGNNKVVKDLFQVIQGGSISSITVAARGQSLNDLGKLNNMVIQGQMHNGEITIPNMQLHLKDASGKVLISHGILEGEKLQARVGNTYGQNGTLKLGLMGGVAPFHLETEVRADLADFPPTFEHLIDDKAVLKKLALLKELKGRAHGKLILGEDTKNLKMKLDASDIHLTARYPGISDPIEIKAENVSYDENRMGVRQLNCVSGKSSLKIRSFSITGKKHDISIKSGEMTWNGMHVKLSGSMKPISQNRLRLAMDVVADDVDLDHIILELKKNKEATNKNTYPSFPSFALQGRIRFKTDRFKIGGFVWNPMHADIELTDGSADVRVNEAALCGISTPARIKIIPQGVEFNLEPIAQDRELDLTLNCLGNETLSADGKFRLKGKIQGHGKVEDLLTSSTGSLEIEVPQGGYIYHDIMLLNVFKFLNTTKILTSRINMQEMMTKGFAYHSFQVKAKLKNGKIIFEEAILRGAPMTITASGEHNLQNGQLYLTLLVAPLVTMDRYFAEKPLIGGIFGKIDAIPLSLRGTYDNIQIKLLSPSAVVIHLADIMKKIVKGPINLIHGGKVLE